MLAFERVAPRKGFQRALDHVVHGRSLKVGIRQQVTRMGQRMQPGDQCLAGVVEIPAAGHAAFGD